MKRKTILWETIKTCLGITSMMILFGLVVTVTTVTINSGLKSLSEVHFQQLIHIDKIQSTVNEILMRNRSIGPSRFTGQRTVQSTARLLATVTTHVGALRQLSSTLGEESTVVKSQLDILASISNEMNREFTLIEKGSPLKIVSRNQAVAPDPMAALDGLVVRFFGELSPLVTAIHSQIRMEKNAMSIFLSRANLSTIVLILLSLGGTALLVVRLLSFVKGTLSGTTATIQNNLSDLRTQMARIIAGLGGNVESLLSASNKIASVSHGFSKSLSSQANGFAQASAALDQINAMLGQTAQHSKSSMDVALKCQEDVMNGHGIVKKMDGSMTEIGLANRNLSEIIQIISSIRNKTKIINDIVVKTQLLSFNASIEAARAGEHGKGFAVVAEEVGKLADTSGQAAEEIRTLLEDSHTKVGGLVDVIGKRVDIASGVSRQCVEVFEKINSQMSHLAKMVNSISTATAEQKQGVEQTSRAMSEIQSANEKNKEITTQTAMDAATIRAQAEQVSSTINQLKSVIERNRTELNQVSDLYGLTPKPAETAIRVAATDEEESFDPQKVVELYRKSSNSKGQSRAA